MDVVDVEDDAVAARTRRRRRLRRLLLRRLLRQVRLLGLLGGDAHDAAPVVAALPRYASITLSSFWISCGSPSAIFSP